MSTSPPSGPFRPPARSPLVVGLVTVVILLSLALVGVLASRPSTSAENSAPTVGSDVAQPIDSASETSEQGYPRYVSTQEMSARMALGGTGCYSYLKNDSAGHGAIERATCGIGGNSMVLGIFPGPEGVAYELEDHRRLNKLFNNVVDVAGPNWLVGGVDDPELAQEIAKALNGVVVDFSELRYDPLPDLEG